MRKTQKRFNSISNISKKDFKFDDGPKCPTKVFQVQKFQKIMSNLKSPPSNQVRYQTSCRSEHFVFLAKNDPKCPNKVILVQNFQKIISDLNSAPSNQVMYQISCKSEHFEVWPKNVPKCPNMAFQVQRTSHLKSTLSNQIRIWWVLVGSGGFWWVLVGLPFSNYGFSDAFMPSFPLLRCAYMSHTKQ